MTGRRALLQGAALVVEAGPAAAQAPPGTLAALTARVNANAIGVIAGGIDGTYARIAADLAAVLDDEERLRILPILGKGSLQNLSDILGLRGIDIGIVQSDVLAFARGQRLIPDLDRRIHCVSKLYDEEIHVLAAPGITSLAQLSDRPVNADVQGSGTAMTARLLFGALGIWPEWRHATQDAALARLLRGEIAALVFVAGKPARLFNGIPADAGLRLLDVPATQPILETYLPARFGRQDYPQLITTEAGVATLAVGAVMAVYAWPPATERHRRVARFVAALQEKFAAFLQPPRHPKWREVNLAAQVPGWTRFDPRAAPMRRGRRDAVVVE